MERLFVDTTAWFGFFNASDPDHGRLVQLLPEWEGRLITTDYVFDELVTLIRLRVGHAEACEAGELLRSRRCCRVVAVTEPDVAAAWQQFAREADKSYSFTDCTSFAAMKRLNLTTAAAVDDHFRQAGFRVVPR